MPEIQRSLYDLLPPEIDALTIESGLPGYRAEQLLRSLYREFSETIDDVRQWPADARRRWREKAGGRR